MTQKMKTTVFTSVFVAVLVVLFSGIVAAANVVDGVSVTMNDLELGEGMDNNVAAFTGQVVPVWVYFESNIDAEDVIIQVELYSGDEKYQAESKRMHVLEGVVYSQLFPVQIPEDLDDGAESVTLEVSIKDADGGTSNYYGEYELIVQRDSYDYSILSTSYDSSVEAGEDVDVSVVIRNSGYERNDDGFVVVSIPELDVSARSYLGDLVSNEECSLVEGDDDRIIFRNCDDDDEDSVYRTLRLNIPEDAEDGSYDLVIEVYNEDVTEREVYSLDIDGSASTSLIPATRTKAVSAGETETFELILVNNADSVKVYNLIASAGSDLDVEVPSVVTVGSNSAETVEIEVTADSDAKGVQTFSVFVDGDEVVFSADVNGSASDGLLVLTVVLAIVFVVLLIVLLVLLFSKKGGSKEIEEVETSYY
jgi:preprotein translocase subunit SecG